jgi:hypothetical protein
MKPNVERKKKTGENRLKRTSLVITSRSMLPRERNERDLSDTNHGRIYEFKDILG